MASIRVNRYLSESGYCSRREADGLIIEGRVTINGEIAEFNSQVNEYDVVEVDDEAIRPRRAIDFTPKPIFKSYKPTKPKVEREPGDDYGNSSRFKFNKDKSNKHPLKTNKKDVKEGFKHNSNEDTDSKIKFKSNKQRSSGHSKGYKPKKSF